MQNNIDSSKDQALLKETILVDIYRGHRGFYNQAPDESLEVQDLVVNNGRVYIAQRIASGDTVASAMNYMAVGTVSTAPALANTTLTGEVSRKTLAVASANPNNVFQAIATFGGAAESITGVALTESGIFNHANSGQGTMMQRVTFSSVTLQDSDLLKITMETNVGSNTI